MTKIISRDNKKARQHYETSQGLHVNYDIIMQMIEPEAKVLDLGCGDGELLKLLKDKKNVKGRGVEINEDNIIKCIEKGLSVFQGDVDEGLKDYQDKSFDYVILNRTLQCTHRPDYVIQEMLRVGKKAVRTAARPDIAGGQIPTGPIGQSEGIVVVQRLDREAAQTFYGGTDICNCTVEVHCPNDI